MKAWRAEFLCRHPDNVSRFRHSHSLPRHCSWASSFWALCCLLVSVNFQELQSPRSRERLLFHLTKQWRHWSSTTPHSPTVSQSLPPVTRIQKLVRVHHTGEGNVWCRHLRPAGCLSTGRHLGEFWSLTSATRPNLHDLIASRSAQRSPSLSDSPTHTAW